MYRVFSNKVIAYLFVLLIIDLCIAPALRIRMVQPIFLYLMIVYAGFNWDWGKSVHVAILAGILRDLTSSQFIGLETATLSGLAIVLETMLHKMDRESTTAKVMATFFFVYASCLTTLVIAWTARSGIGINAHTILHSFYTAIYTTAVMPVFFFITSGIFHDRSSLKQYELFR